MTSPDDHQLIVRKRVRYGIDQWWIGRGSGRNFVFYGDIFSPTGYGFKNKSDALTMAMAIEERLKPRPS